MNLSYRFISFVSKIFPVSPFISKILTPSPAYPLHSNRPGGGGWSFHMSYYSANIVRCTHIKTNGTQCGSPAVRGRRYCFFHKNWHGERIPLGALPAANLNASFTLPVLEDADSIQVALMQVMRLILARQIDPKMAGLLLYALQTASVNLRHTELEPRPRERVVIDPSAAGDSLLGEHLWRNDDFEAEDEEDEDTDAEEEEAEASDDEEEEVEDDEEEKDGDDTLHVGTGALACPAGRQPGAAPHPGATASTDNVDLVAMRHQVRAIAVSGFFRSLGMDLPPEAFPPEAFLDYAVPKQPTPQPEETAVIDPLSPVPLE